MVYSFDETDSKLSKAVQHFREELSLLRTGRATAQMLDPVLVEAYGARMRVHELATVSAPDPTLIMITPWDKSLIEAIAKGISIAGLNLNPVVDGQIIRIVVPPLTHERRQELVKVLHQKAEQARVMIRSIRTDSKKDIEKQKGTADVGEDDIKIDVAELETKIKATLEQLEMLVTDKEKELLTV